MSFTGDGGAGVLDTDLRRADLTFADSDAGFRTGFRAAGLGAGTSFSESGTSKILAGVWEGGGFETLVGRATLGFGGVTFFCTGLGRGASSSLSGTSNMFPDFADGVLDTDLSRIDFSFDGVVGRTAAGAVGAILLVSG